LLVHDVVEALLFTGTGVDMGVYDALGPNFRAWIAGEYTRNFGAMSEAQEAN
jgi:hypothetical protein